jgi:Ulp1 family protease
VWDTSSWREEYPQAIPQQNNGVDCGVFALMFCNRMSVRGGGFDFTQQDISVNVRAAIVCDLLDGAISATRWGR